jgi:hypothetical protein
VRYHEIPVELRDAFRIARRAVPSPITIQNMGYGEGIWEHEAYLKSLDPAYWLSPAGKDALAWRRCARPDAAAPEAERDAGAQPPRQYVTLDMAAATVQRSKRTLQKAIGRDRHPLPDPDIQGMGGKANEWLWDAIRPWLEREYNRKLPAVYPGAMPPRR